MKTCIRLCAAMLVAASLSACAAQVSPSPSLEVGTDTRSHLQVATLPPPNRRVVVAVYDFPDLTGQFKQAENFQTLSRAVTQGASAMLVGVLQDAGGGAWFKVAERKNLENLLKERQIIREMRATFEKAPQPLEPLLYAGVIFEGAVVGFDTNMTTGGLGARYLGIGGDVQYREDVVTIYLRAVSTRTGEVLRTVHASKKIISYGASAGIFKFVSFKKLLEFESGFTSNEPATLALKQAIEEAVFALVLEGSEQGLWGFHDQEAGKSLIRQYRQSRDTAAVPPVPETAASTPSTDRNPIFASTRFH